MRLLLTDESKTIEFGRCLGKLLTCGAVVTLTGDLGAGKTTLTKGIARGLGVEEMVTSPTFALLHLYQGREELAHIDAYRIGSFEEGLEAGLADYLPGDGITVVEWAENITELLPEQYLQIKLSCPQQQEGRFLETWPHGERFRRVEKEMEGHCR